jgi:hypothetical protein
MRKQPSLKKADTGHAGSGHETSFGQIEGAKTVDVNEVGLREGFTKRTFVTKCALLHPFGRGLAGGSREAFETRRRDSMQRKDWPAPPDAQKDQLRGQEGNESPDQSYQQKPKRI